MFQIKTKNIKLLNILLSQNQTNQNISHYPLKPKINYSTINSKNKPNNQQISQFKILHKINFLQHKHIQKKIQYLQQKQTQKKNIPIINNNNLQTIFLNKYSI